MSPKTSDKRKNKRYDTSVKVYFHYPYDINTKVDYQLIDKKHEKVLSPKYTGISKNVSVEGLCFHSEQHLHGGDNLLIELHLPGDRGPVLMEGLVRWCEETLNNPGYDTGVKLLTVDGKSVAETVHYDNAYHVEWSAVLESVLGKFRLLSKKRRK
ncbi:MAG TPA: PilZ domain-containing protein [Candidatus Omnitrophota bacterium]|nr:PilZ domain-containing protein [Candidatus Omnitrophota bacterium]